MPVATTRPLVPGVWAPIPTFFDANEEIGKASRSFVHPDKAHHSCPALRFTDVPTFVAHTVRLAQAKMNPVICGSMGEAHHLTNEERTTLIKAARKGLDEAGLNDATIIAGT